MPFIDIAEQESFSEEKMRKVALCETGRMLFDVYCLLPGQAQKVHAHDDVDKVYVVQRGAVVAVLGQEERTLGPGQAAAAPAGVPHGVRNESGEPATVLVFQARPVKG
jgi:mannose-6-phosphate isomerase-like protein (cupin superfamily)